MFFFIIGLILIAPQFLAMHSLGSYNTCGPFLFQSNEDNYMARIQEIIDGHYSFLPFYEYKDTSSFPMLVPIAEYWYAIQLCF